MRYFEDIQPGDEETFGDYLVSREEIIDFAGKYDPQPFHLDEAAARQSIFGALCASGWQTCAIAMRLMVDKMSETKTASLGSPGVQEIRWLKPVFPGDRLTLTTKVLATKASQSRPTLGSVTSSWTLTNQDGVAVMTLTATAFFGRRPQGEAA
ncbi:MAG: MaoC family dehydratase [Rhodothalassiaceae bacterium]